MKRLIIILTIGLLAFGLGWWTNEMGQFAKGVNEDSKRIGTLENDSVIIVSQEQLTWLSKDNNFSLKINGRFILNDATCAGFEFLNREKIVWRNELTCSSPDTLAIFWLDEKTFITKDINIESVSKDCPPRISLYKVYSFDGQNLKLKDLWTGWGAFETDTLILTLKK